MHFTPDCYHGSINPSYGRDCKVLCLSLFALFCFLFSFRTLLPFLCLFIYMLSIKHHTLYSYVFYCLCCVFSSSSSPSLGWLSCLSSLAVSSLAFSLFLSLSSLSLNVYKYAFMLSFIPTCIYRYGNVFRQSLNFYSNECALQLYRLHNIGSEG